MTRKPVSQSRTLKKKKKKKKTTSSAKVHFKLDEAKEKGVDSHDDGIVFDDDAEDTFEEKATQEDKKGKGKGKDDKVAFKLDEETEEGRESLDEDEVESDDGDGGSGRGGKIKKKRKKAVKHKKGKDKDKDEKDPDDEDERDEEEGDGKKTARKQKPKKTATKIVTKREVVDKKKMMLLAKKNMEMEKALDNFKRAYRSLREEVDTITSDRDTKDAILGKYQNKLDLYAQDFDNFKDRVKKEKKIIEVQGNRKLIKKMLDIYDNFERAMQNTKSTDKAEGLLDAVELMRKRFIAILEEDGVEAIESVGNKFDPWLHEALAMIENDEYDDGIICLELQKGFLFKKDPKEEEKEEEAREDDDSGEEKDEGGEKKKKKIRKVDLVRPSLVHVSKGSGTGKKKRSGGKDKESELISKPEKGNKSREKGKGERPKKKFVLDGDEKKKRDQKPGKVKTKVKVKKSSPKKKKKIRKS